LFSCQSPRLSYFRFCLVKTTLLNIGVPYFFWTKNVNN